MAQMVNGGWYNAKQYWNGVLGKVGQIINPNQSGSVGGGGGGGGGGSFGGAGAFKAPPPPPPPPRQQQTLAKKKEDVFVNGTPDWVKPMISSAAQAYKIPTAVLSGLLKQESNFNPRAKSPAGAIGIAQFMPSTAQSRKIDPSDPTQAIHGAAQYLRDSLDKFGGNMEKALASYNAGIGAVQRYKGVPPYPETQNYVKNIMNMANEVGASVFNDNSKNVNQSIPPTQSEQVNSTSSSQDPSWYGWMKTDPNYQTEYNNFKKMDELQGQITDMRKPGQLVLDYIKNRGQLASLPSFLTQNSSPTPSGVPFPNSNNTAPSGNSTPLPPVPLTDQSSQSSAPNLYQTTTSSSDPYGYGSSLVDEQQRKDIKKRRKDEEIA